MKQHSALHIILILVIALIAVTGCSTQKNTARNRWLHAFHSKYNIYYNGTLAYIDASLEKEQGNKDNSIYGRIKFCRLRKDFLPLR